MSRTFWRGNLTSDSSVDPVTQDRVLTTEENANLISSLTENGLHMPALDIDLPAELRPSSTPGHFHLFIDKPITWRQYRRVLRALKRAGLIEDAVYRLSVKRKATFIRTHPKGVRDK